MDVLIVCPNVERLYFFNCEVKLNLSLNSSLT